VQAWLALIVTHIAPRCFLVGCPVSSGENIIGPSFARELAALKTITSLSLNPPAPCSFKVNNQILERFPKKKQRCPRSGTALFHTAGNRVAAIAAAL
jgi:hypothetical protein